MGKTLNIAHRGGAALKPENTMAAFSAAIARGCDGAELDVQLSADGVVVVPRDDAEQVAKLSAQRIAKEEQSRGRLKNGELGLDFYGLRAKLKELGVEYTDEEV